MQFYIGYTEDIQRRLNEHNQGKVYTTYRLGSPKLIYYEAYNEESEAKEREKKLKQFGSSYTGLLKRLKLR
jgi:putative endonuclease